MLFMGPYQKYMFLSGVSYLASLDVKLPYFETACRDTNNHPIDLMKALLAGTHTFNKGLKNLFVSVNTSKTYCHLGDRTMEQPLL